VVAAALGDLLLIRIIELEVTGKLVWQRFAGLAALALRLLICQKMDGHLGLLWVGKGNAKIL
jgi:hypothetical protein